MKLGKNFIQLKFKWMIYGKKFKGNGAKISQSSLDCIPSTYLTFLTISSKVLMFFKRPFKLNKDLIKKKIFNLATIVRLILMEKNKELSLCQQKK